MKNKCVSQKILSYLKEYWYLICLAILLVFLQAGFEVLNAKYQKEIVDSINQRTFDKFKLMLIIGFSIFFLTTALRLTNKIFSRYFDVIIEKCLKLDIMEWVHKIPLLKFEKYNPGQINSLIINDTGNASHIASQLIETIGTNVIVFIAASVYLLMLNPVLTLIILLSSLIAFFFNFLLNKRIKKYSLLINQKKGDIQGYLENSISNINIVKSYNTEETMTDKFILLRESLANLMLKHKFYSTLLASFLDFFNFAVLGGVGFYVSYLAINGELSIGAIMAFNTLFARMIGSIMGFSKSFGNLQSTFAAWERIGEFTDIDVQKTEDEPGKNLFLQNEDILTVEFKDISFSYNGKKDIFSDTQLVAKKGELYGLVGKSGTGKSTLFKILLNLYNSEESMIKFNDRYKFQLKDIDLTQIISYVPQLPTLRSGTVKDNLCFGKSDLLAEKAKGIAKSIGLSHLFDKLPEGIETKISEGGSSLSGGQRQMIAILRAVINDTPIIMLDEPFSNLDSSIVEELMQSLLELKEDRIIIFSSHQLDPLQYCDRIGKISDNKIIEFSSYQEFINQNTFYKVNN